MAILGHSNWYMYFFNLTGNKDMHKRLDEFEFKPDQTIDYGVTCP